MTRSYQHQDNYIQGDKVWFQYKDGLAWHVPREVIYYKGNAVFIHSNGNVKKVAACKVKPYELKEREEERKKVKIEKPDWNKWIEETERSKPEEVIEEEKDEQKEEREEQENEKEESEEQENEKEVENEKLKDVIGAKYLKMEKSVCFLESSVYVVEVPVREHGKAEVIEAKEKEIENLKLYETFEEIDDEGQETIGSRWIVTEKEKHDGQKQNYKARLVAKGFQERDQPQSDSPTAAKESFKLLVALAANQNFRVVSMDIRAAFLQAKKLDREVFVRPPDDIKKEGKIWKLLKPLYGLDDASRKFYLKVKETLQELGLKTLPGDDAFYYENKNGVLMGMNLSHVDNFTIAGEDEFVERIVNGISRKLYLKVKETLQELGLKTLPGDDVFYYENKNGKLMGLNLSHVDDFTIAGEDEFVERIVKGIERKFTVSKVEKDEFRFTGLDVKAGNGKIEVLMEDYANSVEEIKEIRKADRAEKLTKT